MKLFSSAVACLLASSTGSMAAVEITGNYAATGSNDCLISQAGFNADDSAILPSGDFVAAQPQTFAGVFNFNPRTKRGTFAGKGVLEDSVFVAGNPPSNFFFTSQNTYNWKFRYSTGQDKGGNLTLTIILDSNGGISGKTIAGYGVGQTYVDSYPDSDGIVQGIASSNGTILLRDNGAPVIGSVTTDLNGNIATLGFTCNVTGTLIPVK